MSDSTTRKLPWRWTVAEKTDSDYPAHCDCDACQEMSEFAEIGRAAVAAQKKSYLPRSEVSIAWATVIGLIDALEADDD